MSSRLLKVLSASGGEDAYEIEQSLMFDSVDEAHLARTVSSAGNRRTWTQSCWFKLNKMADGYLPMFGFPGGSAYGWRYGIPYFIDDGDLNFLDNWGGGSYSGPYVRFKTAIKDRSAWYHFVIVFDTTESTDTNRIKVWINNVQATPHTHLSWPSLNYQGSINSTLPHTLGEIQLTYYYADAQFAEYHFLDGTVKAPTDFAETDSVTGQWVPKEYTGGSYGTNGFYFKFESGALGTDSSGQGNNFTATNLANSDVMLDSPTNNFCTLNSIASGDSIFSQGNLKCTTGGNTNRIAVGTMSTPSSGKWYWECKPTNLTGGCGIGVGNLGSYQTSVNSYVGNYAGTYLWYSYSGNGYKDVNGSNSSVAQSFAANDVVGVALDLDAGTLTMYKNGSSQLQVASGLSGQFEPVFGDGSSHNTATFEVNFGQKDFAHTPPSNHLALSTSNLPTPTIKNGRDHFNTVLYTGNETDRSITGVGFEPSWVWIKERSAGGSHRTFDQVRGVNKMLMTDLDREELDRTEVTAFNADGFSLSGSSVTVNQNNVTHVAWNWKGGGSGSSNTDGSINSTVSANTTAGFSIVTWTGNGNTVTVGHGLGAVPQVYIMKRRDSSNYWWVGTRKIDGSHDYGVLDTTASISNSGLTVPTSSVFYTDGSQNTNNATYVAYVFAEVEGFSKFEKYVGNGSTDGPFINTGFRPAYVLIKNAVSGKGWTIFDTTRDINNPTQTEIYAHDSIAEASPYTNLDILSNGFKIRATNSWVNGSGNSIFYMAFAEAPFKYANAR